MQRRKAQYSGKSDRRQEDIALRFSQNQEALKKDINKTYRLAK
jgi:hypothetical protein